MLTLMRWLGMQDGVSSLVNKSGPPSPTGKRKWRGQGRGGQNPHSPADVTGPPCSHTAAGGGEVAGTLPRGG
jgi:hypothetical protein